MIAKITRGSNLVGLVSYLLGPGRGEQHTEARVIASGPSVDVEHGITLDRADVRALGAQMDLSRRLHGTVIIYRHTGKGDFDGNVWHLSLSNPATDRVLTDDEWSNIARDVVGRMGFAEGGGCAPCPWVAVRHGRSAGGNDHIHIAVSLVRDDGTPADVFRDRITVGRACTAYERQYGLQVVEGRRHGSAAAPHRPEIEAARRRGDPEPDRTWLARRVRAAAISSRDEAEFVRHLRAGGIMVRPRYAKGSGRGVVEGYSVAVRRASGDGPQAIFYGGGSLARDLRLPALRAAWQTGPERQAQALTAWSGSRASDAIASDRSSRSSPFPAGTGAGAGASARVASVRTQVERLSTLDEVGLMAVTRDAAGLLAAVACRFEPIEPGLWSRAADLLADGAQVPRGRRPPAARAGFGALQEVARLAMRPGPASWDEILIQVVKLVEALDRAHDAAANATRARQRATIDELRSERAVAPTRGPRRSSAVGRDPYGPGPGHVPTQSRGRDHGFER